MTRIGLLSDTHGYIDDKILSFFKNCDEIWHAGDIGNIAIANKLSEITKFRAVYGNIDGTEVRTVFKKDERFNCEDINVWITHIGGYPKRYDTMVRERIRNNPPDIFISGHSHILKVINDKELDLLHINPGAAGNSGMHQVRTVVRFVVDGKNIKDMEVLEIKR
ncbi:MAG: metallophosphoesterase family protein [Bacteroidales bacterium]|jgi:putative phosphoesterase|nr:metallophosphoesterase family protein [Bacteroidales bacterium]